MKKAEIIAKLKVSGVSLTGKENYKELQALLKENAGADVKSSNSIEKGNLIVWLKSRTYIENNLRLDAGIYSMSEIPARISKLPSNLLEVFDSAVPARKLAAMAKWAGITHPEDYSDEELLEKVVSEPKPF